MKTQIFLLANINSEAKAKFKPGRFSYFFLLK